MNGPAADRVVTPERALAMVRRWREAGEQVVIVAGAFDLLTVEHATGLASSRQGDRLVVVVWDDRSLAARGGRGRPVLTARDRAALVAALRGVDLVVILDVPAPGAPQGELSPLTSIEPGGGRDPVARVRERCGGSA